MGNGLLWLHYGAYLDLSYSFIEYPKKNIYLSAFFGLREGNEKINVAAVLGEH